LDIFDHAKPAGVREKSALLHDAQESNTAPPARAPRPLLGLQQDRRAAAIKPRRALRVVRPQELREASHPDRRPIAARRPQDGAGKRGN